MLWDYIKKRMMENPDKTVSDDSESITYAQLIEYAEDKKTTLLHDKYGVLCKSELNAAKAILSIMAAGKICVPLHHSYGQSRIDKILANANISYLIEDNGVKQISQETTETENLSDVIFIMYTSGTTGTPKGAMLTEENILTNLHDIEQYFKIDNTDKILIWRSLYHLAPLTGEFLISLVKGLDIIFYENGFDPTGIRKAIKDNEITVIAGTPSLFYHLCNPSINRSSSIVHRSLKALASSGECMTKPVAERMMKTLDNCDIYNIYGLTEASPRVSYLPPEMFKNDYTSVGIPLNSVEVKIQNGELLVKGNSIMKGYYNDKESTDKTIINGWLHTGDNAEIDENGFITVKGRIDNMIIRGGMNIYPAEIENAVKQDSRIKDAVAVGEKDDKSSQRIRLTIVCNHLIARKNLTKKDVFDICKKYLQPYQYPEIIEIVDKLEMTRTGKKMRT